MSEMFLFSPFNQPIGKWNTNNVKSMNSMFYNASNFNQSIKSWNISKVTDCARMFIGTPMAISNMPERLGSSCKTTS